VEIRGLCCWSVIRVKTLSTMTCGECSAFEKMTAAYRILVGKLGGKRKVGRGRGREKDNIKIYITKIGNVGMDWIDLPCDRDEWRDFVNTTLDYRVPWNVEN